MLAVVLASGREMNCTAIGAKSPAPLPTNAVQFDLTAYQQICLFSCDHSFGIGYQMPVTPVADR
jgi:hypothetical protein